MTTNPPADAAKVRLEQTIAQLSRMERNAAFGGAGTSVRVSDAPYLIQTLTLVQSSLAAQASQIEALRIQVSELDGRQRVALINQDGAEVGHGWHARKELLREEVYCDENGTVWNRPTAWAYHQVCAARTDWQSRATAAEASAAKMREALEALLTASQPQHSLKHVFIGEAQEKARAALDQEARP